jgi:hypothetical protein
MQYRNAQPRASSLRIRELPPSAQPVHRIHSLGPQALS